MCFTIGARVQMREPEVEHIKEAIGGRRSFQTAKLTGVDISLDIVN